MLIAFQLLLESEVVRIDLKHVFGLPKNTWQGLKVDGTV